ncbi:Tat pathway signal sequence domain protein [Streptomyces sp. SA15]|nr:Tat pathway signal sequence domain protein [Streptomyces sp. SA15]
MEVPVTTTRRAFGALAAGAALAALTPTPATATPGHRRGRLIARDDFRHGLDRWAVELQDGGTVTASRGVLEIDVPSGATVWFKKRLEGPYVLEYTATPVSEGGVNDRVSDLNNFWNAVDVRSPDDLFATPRGGALEEYDYLKTYYAGYGANYNTTTRLRRYVGEAGVRPLVYDYTEPLLVANRPHRVRIVSDGTTVQWWNNGRIVFDYTDPEPYTEGHFAFRTVWSHFRISGFRVWRWMPEHR